MSWSPDGRFILYVTAGVTGTDVWALPLFGDRKPFPYLQTRFGEYPAVFSPDGGWVAYTSNESGQPEVYVATFPKFGGKRQISTGGGRVPRWRRDGRELFYLTSTGTLMAAAVDVSSAGVDVKSIQPLFGTRATGDFPYDVSADGQRFIIVSSAEDSASATTVVVNWTPTKR
jgi:Tol biopolymer transport system component